MSVGKNFVIMKANRECNKVNLILSQKLDLVQYFILSIQFKCSNLAFNSPVHEIACNVASA